MTRHAVSACRLLALVAIFAVGCTQKLPVTGNVTLIGGGPVEGATVRFESIGGGPNATGVTDANGDFQLTTDSPDDGAPTGEYNVTVHHPYPEDSSQARKMNIFDLKYESAKTSGLTFDVGPENLNFEIQLEKAKPKS